MPAPASSTEALAADPFVSIMDALPEHVRMSRRFIRRRTALFLATGFGTLALAWWFSTQ